MQIGCLLSVLTTFCVLFYGITGYAVEAFLEAPDAPMTQPEVEQFIGFSIPPEAGNIYYTSVTGIDRTVYVRFSLPAAMLPSFVASIPAGLKLQKQYWPFSGTPLPNGVWQFPNNAKIFIGASLLQGDKFYNLLIDETDAQNNVVYLVVGTL